MPLELLLSLVIGGIGAIAILLHWLGKSAPMLLDRDSARSAWARQYPDDRVGEVVVSTDRRAALIATDHGAGLVWSFGADTVARRLRDFSILPHKSAMRLRFRDYTAPGLTLHLSPAEREAWSTWIKERT